jgi:dTDP-4-dehydrorhamnose 3,5-epimerase
VPEIVPSPEIDGVVVVELDEHADRRGTFVEPWRKEWFPGLPDMVQANHSEKAAGSLVGLHYHLHQADYWYVLSGQARVVLHDLRRSSATRNTTLVLEMSGEHRRGVYIPPGVGHGFAAHSALSLLYLVDRYYNPDDELGVAYDDPELRIDWGLAAPILSVRDERNPRLNDIAEHLVPP